MNARGSSARRWLALGLVALACLAAPLFAQEAPPAPPPAPASKKPSSTQNSTLRTEHKQSPVQPEGLSPQSSIAPRATVDTLMEVKRRAKLRVGVSMIAPWAMHDKDGNLIGFEIDVAKKMARDLGVDLEFYPDEFHYLIPDLLDARFDLIISGFSISTNRAMKVNFSAPYNYTDLSLAANRKLARDFSAPADFDKPTVTIGVLDTSTAVDIASNAFPNA